MVIFLIKWYLYSILLSAGRFLLSCQIPKGSAKFVYTAFDKPEDGTRSLLTLKNDEQYIIKIDYKTKTIEVYTEKRKNTQQSHNFKVIHRK